ncbi:MAG: RecQ family ATP-dependent DNA helicase [Ignavibacteriae bacterium]|nr:MAG: RecQ family ATP-dependent DNA helicase [Ignavibacteriota bacterium]
MNREIAEEKLKNIFRLNKFYDEQWRAIDKILNGERVLLIEKTGFGKSLCFQFPAVIQSGVTIVFSPLIALMRDQVSYLNRLNIPARCINSEQEDSENKQILCEAEKGRIKILYIAPERQENIDWIESVRRMNLKMVVIDEAHCISVWGHDFRPAYRRIINLVKLLPSNFPVLATTATATEKVAQDIISQIGGKITYLRGKLLRNNFYLNVVKAQSDSHKMAWLAEFLQNEQGTGIIYTGTRADTDIYSNWLKHAGISCISYNAGLDAETRKEIEQDLMENRWKCIVSTNALGMGINKPDIRFIVHTQVPGSPIHYYQEIGRAGRDGKPTKIVLLYKDGDRELPEVFIDTAKPTIDKYIKVVDELKKEPLGEYDLMRRTNLKNTYIRVIKADLIDQGIIREANYGKVRKMEYIFGAPYFNTGLFEKFRASKMKELDAVIKYAEIKTCRMNYLRSYLGDKVDCNCGKCDNDLGINNNYNLSGKWKKKLVDFKDNFFPVLEMESKTLKIINGVASSYYGFSNVGSMIHKCKYENGGDFPEYLVKQTVNAFNHQFKDINFDLILYVPPTESGDLVKNFAMKISKELKIPVSHKLKKARMTQPQKMFQNRVLKIENVKDAFCYEDQCEVQFKSILLIDDIYDSGTSIKEIGMVLAHMGVWKIAPLVIAKTIGGDIQANA